LVIVIKARVARMTSTLNFLFFVKCRRALWSIAHVPCKQRINKKVNGSYNSQAVTHAAGIAHFFLTLHKENMCVQKYLPNFVKMEKICDFAVLQACTTRDGKTTSVIGNVCLIKSLSFSSLYDTF
jgi:hypothetical protein